MSISDPTAIPETQADADEYLRAADDYWSNHRHDEALTLYWAVLQSPFGDPLPDNRESDIMLRVGTIAEERGDQNRAWRAYQWGELLGNEQCKAKRIALDGELPDQAVDPTVVPMTLEAVREYLRAAAQAESSDTELATRLYEALLQSNELSPGNRGDIAYRLGLLYQQGGSHDAAYQMFSEAATMTSDRYHDAALAALRQYQHQDGTDRDDLIASGTPTDEQDAGRYLQAAIDAYDRGDTGRAEAMATVVVSSSAASGAQRGSAHYYLGAIAYYANNFDVARTHLDNAAANADDPYRAWATEMLQYRWQDR
jgi:lipopolysaccharide biosynthesis regulator YciM